MSTVPDGAARSVPNVEAPDAREARLEPVRALAPVPSCHDHHASAVPSADAVIATGLTNRCGSDTFCVADQGGSAAAAAGSTSARSAVKAARRRPMLLE